MASEPGGLLSPPPCACFLENEFSTITVAYLKRLLTRIVLVHSMILKMHHHDPLQVLESALIKHTSNKKKTTWDCLCRVRTQPSGGGVERTYTDIGTCTEYRALYSFMIYVLDTVEIHWPRETGPWLKSRPQPEKTSALDRASTGTASLSITGPTSHHLHIFCSPGLFDLVAALSAWLSVLEKQTKLVSSYFFIFQGSFEKVIKGWTSFWKNFLTTFP